MWQNIEGHDTIVSDFARAFAKGRLEGAYLFLGQEGIGKRSFAFALAATLLCKNLSSQNFQNGISLDQFVPCGTCESCRMFFSFLRASEISEEKKVRKKKITVTSNSFQIPEHPDFVFVNCPEDRKTIPIDLLIGAKDERMQAGLCYELSLKPYFEGRKVAIIDDADCLSTEGANALLKTLEEPPSQSILILIGTSAARQLPTIRSRCQIIRFSPLKQMNLARAMVRAGIVSTFEEGESLARNVGGSILFARMLNNSELLEFREKLFRFFADGFPEAVSFTENELIPIVESAGKESSLKRNRLNLLLDWSVEFFRDLVRYHAGGTTNPFYRRAIETWVKDPILAEMCALKTLDASEQVASNIILPSVIDSWIYSLERIIRP